VTKEELIYLTLKQLNESLKSSPENFRLEDTEAGIINNSYHGPTIVWQFKVETQPGTYIQDPLNATRTVIATYNKLSKQISCYIYFREVNSINHAIMADSQMSLHLSQFPILNRTYRQFMKLRNKLLDKRREKEYLDYLKKLNNIFPSTHVDELFE
jgi:hypothetical protein